MTRLPPHAWRLPAGDVAHLASLGYPHCDTGRCEEPPAWVFWHWWTGRAKVAVAEVFLCEEHAAAYRRRRPDTEVKTYEENE